MIGQRTAGPRRWTRFGIGAHLFASNAVVVVVSVVTTTLVAALVGPPMFQRLMDAAVRPGLNNDHPYQRVFQHATAMSVGTALAVSVLAALTLSWYLSRRLHRSATELAQAASAVANGHYDIRVSPTRLGREFNDIAVAFNTMAQQLGDVETHRRQMLADLAHELRTPVAILEAYMEALEDGVQQFDADTMGVLRDQTRRLTRFSADVGSLSSAEQNSRSSTIDARWVSIEQLVAAALTAFEPRYRAKGVTLRSEVSANVPQLWADPERLGQVLGNLLDNALRHTGSADDVLVTASATTEAVIVAVSDTGDGVPVAHQSRLFDRFYRVDAARDREHGGAGIGLSIARAFVEAHGGQISVRSAGTGLGSIFTFTVPRRHLQTMFRPTAARAERAIPDL